MDPRPGYQATADHHGRPKPKIYSSHEPTLSSDSDQDRNDANLVVENIRLSRVQCETVLTNITEGASNCAGRFRWNHHDRYTLIRSFG